MALKNGTTIEIINTETGETTGPVSESKLHERLRRLGIGVLKEGDVASFYAEISKATVNEVKEKIEGQCVGTVATLLVGLESTDCGDHSVDDMRGLLADMMRARPNSRVRVDITLEQSKLEGTG